MNSFKKMIAFFALAAVAVAPLAACSQSGKGVVKNPGGDVSGSVGSERPADSNEVPDIDVDDSVYDYTLKSEEDGNYVYEDESGNEAAFSVTYVSGTDGCYSVSGNTLTFSGITENSVYSVTGTFYGNIVVDAGDDYKFELEMAGFSLTSYTECPVNIVSGDKVTLSAKKNTENYIYDQREEAGEEDISASVYALCDLNIQGKGDLYIKSVGNNGIHTKDDLNVKNLNLQVDCRDNA